MKLSFLGMKEIEAKEMMTVEAAAEMVGHTMTEIGAGLTMETVAREMVTHSEKDVTAIQLMMVGLKTVWVTKAILMEHWDPVTDILAQHVI